MFLPFFYGPTASRTCNLRLIPPVETRSPPIGEVGQLLLYEDNTLSVHSQSMYISGLYNLFDQN